MNSLNPRLSIITATPPGYNPGMLAVELAAHDFLRRHNFLTYASFFRILSMKTRMAHVSSAEFEQAARLADIGIHFKVLESVDELDGTTPVFWGDFLHMAQYNRALARFLVAVDRFPTCAAAEAYLMQILLLEGASAELIRRTISFGSTLLFNNMTDTLESRYWNAFADFASSIKLFKVRDVFSASYLRGLRPPSSVYAFGPDAAELLRGDRLECIKESRGLKSHAHLQSNDALIYFGRDCHDWACVRETVDRFERRLRCKFLWLPWGDDLAFPLLPKIRPFAIGFPQAHEQSPAPFFDLLSLAQQASLIITDTYHLAVIGWTLGVPVICIKGDSTDLQANVNGGSFFAQRDKRFVFYAQNDLLDFFLDGRTFSNQEIYSLWVEHVVEIIGAGMFIRKHLERSREFVVSSEAELIAAMQGFTAREPEDNC
jgi:hypothetical protein